MNPILRMLFAGRSSYRWLAALIVLAAAPSAFAPMARADSLTLPANGCPMAHCDNQMSGNINIQLPVTGAVSLVTHEATVGSLLGLGCVSSGSGGVVACSLDQAMGNTASLVVYDGDGNLKWSSSIFDGKARASAPIIDANNNIVAADDRIIARFNASGGVVWQQSIPGGTPISPVVVNGTMILCATQGGPISLFSYTDGALLGTLQVTDAAGNMYDTINTPSVNGNAVYVSLEQRNNKSIGELAKIVINPSANPVMSVNWTFPFGGPSGASPHYNPVTNTIYFDGSSLNPGGSGPPVLFAVVDAGNAPQLKWYDNLPARLPAAVVQDPRGGVWGFSAGIQYLWRFNEADGTILQTIDANALINSPRTTNGPSSAMTVTSNSVMLVGTLALAGGGPSYVTAINLLPSTGALIWKYMISFTAIGDEAFGQFPIVINSAGTARIVFTSRASGAYFLTPSPCCWKPTF